MSFVQTKDKIYVTHGYSNNDDGYNICKIVVYPDSSYTFKTYKVAKRKDRKKYKSTTPIISFGKIKSIHKKSLESSRLFYLCYSEEHLIPFYTSYFRTNST